MYGGFLQSMKEFWAQKGPELPDKIDWAALFHSPYFIGLAVVVLAFTVYKRMYRFLALVFCSSAFYFACRQIGSGGGESFITKNILSFIALCIAIIFVAVYFFFIRSE